MLEGFLLISALNLLRLTNLKEYVLEEIVTKSKWVHMTPCKIVLVLHMCVYVCVVLRIGGFIC